MADQEKNSRSEYPGLIDKLKVGMAVGTTAAAGMIGLGHAAEAHAENLSLASITHTEKTRKPEVKHRLRSITELPGFGKGVTEVQREQLADSTVKILVRHKGMEAWTELCTGVKIAVTDPNTGQATEGISTAAHCASLITEAEWGIMKAGDGIFGAVDAPAIDVLDPQTSQYEFALADGTLPVPDREAQPLAMVNHLTVSLQEKDMAFMTVDPESIQPPPPGHMSYNDIPAIPFDSSIKTEAGSAVALLGIPDSSGDKPVMGTGMFAGETTMDNILGSEEVSPVTAYADGSKQPVYVVAIKAQSPETDSCQFSASGSGAKTASGQTLVNLTYRINIGYGPKHKMAPQSPPRGTELNLWHEWEKKLNVKLPEKYFDTLCFYPAAKTSDILKLAKAQGQYISTLAKKP